MIFQYKGNLVRKKLTSLRGSEPGASRDGKVNKLILPARTELIVQVPVDAGLRVREGLVERAERVPGVYMAESLVKVTNGRAITSLINITAEEVELVDYVAMLEEIDDRENGGATAEIGRGKGGDDQNFSRGERVVTKLRDEHLNEEEKRSLRAMCFEYQDVFYLPGDILS